jgi:ankyrin repeat protein
MEGQSKSTNGGTPLNRAACYGRLELGQCLLDHGANIHAGDSDRHTPLIHAVLEGEGHVEFARMLLERGATINARDSPAGPFASLGYREICYWSTAQMSAYNTPFKLVSLYGN